MEWLILWLLAANLAGFISMGIDKSRARRGKWRIPEKTLLLIAAAGGSAGSLVGMYYFRHKTKHKKFTAGIPCILLLELAAAVLIYLACRQPV